MEGVFLVLGLLFCPLLLPGLSYKCIAWMLFLQCFEWPMVCLNINILFCRRSDCGGFLLNYFEGHFPAIYSRLKAVHPEQNWRQTYHPGTRCLKSQWHCPLDK